MNAEDADKDDQARARVDQVSLMMKRKRRGCREERTSIMHHGEKVRRVTNRSGVRNKIK